MLENGQTSTPRSPRRRCGRGGRAPVEVFNSQTIRTGSVGSSARSRPVSAVTSRRSHRMSSPSASVPPVPSKSWLAWPWRCSRSRPVRSTASSSLGQRSRRGSGRAFPGDLMQKVDLYLRPLYDALYDMTDDEGVQRLLERGTVEVAPLKFGAAARSTQLHHPRRGPEHEPRADEDVHPHRLGLGRRHRRHQPVDVQGGRSGLLGLERILKASTASGSYASVRRTLSGTRSCRTSPTPRGRRCRARRHPERAAQSGRVTVIGLDE